MDINGVERDRNNIKLDHRNKCVKLHDFSLSK